MIAVTKPPKVKDMIKMMANVTPTAVGMSMEAISGAGTKVMMHENVRNDGIEIASNSAYGA